MTLWGNIFCSRKNFGEFKIVPMEKSSSPDCSVAKASFDTFLTLRKVYTPKDLIVPHPTQSFRAIRRLAEPEESKFEEQGPLMKNRRPPDRNDEHSEPFPNSQCHQPTLMNI
jgi:hypothetical protein